MFAELARSDLESLRAAGFKPTDADVIRLNELAVRIERGKETTVANMPRIAYAGNVVLHEPTIGSLEWWHNYGRDAAFSTRGKMNTYYFCLAHATRPEVFDGLTDARKIRNAVRAWMRTVFATDGELWRAVLWVRQGVVGESSEQPTAVTSSVDDDEQMDRLYTAVIAAAGALSMRPQDLRTQTADTLTALLVAANLHNKIPMKSSIARDYIAYKSCLKEIESRGRCEQQA